MSASPKRERNPRRGDERAPPARRSSGVAPIVSLVGLVVVAVLSFGMLGGSLPDFVSVRKLPAGDVANRTPNPVVVFTPVAIQPPKVLGTILFAKNGNLWSVSGNDTLTQLTTDGSDQSPTWGPNGRTIYFVHVVSKHTQVPCEYITGGGCIPGSRVNYTLQYPVISRMAPAPGAASTPIANGLYSLPAGGQYFYGLWQPDVSPDGKTIALVSDSTNPFLGSDALSTIPATGGQVRRLQVPEATYYGLGLGQNDPQWSPDGSLIAYTYNDKQGSYGAPRIALYDVAKGTARFLTAAGYAQPSWSPDGRYLAAVRSTARGRDVVILDAHTGELLSVLTHDARSFAPTWSPAGDQIAFLQANGTTIDLHLITLGGTAPHFTAAKEEPLTSQSQLDGQSRPAWYIPPSEMPQATPPVASPAAAESPAPGGSAP